MADQLDEVIQIAHHQRKIAFVFVPYFLWIHCGNYFQILKRSVYGIVFLQMVCFVLLFPQFDYGGFGFDFVFPQFEIGQRKSVI